MSMGTAGKSKRLIGLGLAMATSLSALILLSGPATAGLGIGAQRSLPATVGGNVWSLRDSQTTGNSNNTFLYGDPDDFPIMGDWNGDGEKTPGIVQGNVWTLRNSNDTGVGEIVFRYGDPGDFPIVGDWDGDGFDTPGINRGNFYALRNSNDSGFGDTVFTFGDPEAFPVIWAAPALMATGR